MGTDATKGKKEKVLHREKRKRIDGGPASQDVARPGKQGYDKKSKGPLPGTFFRKLKREEGETVRRGGERGRYQHLSSLVVGRRTGNRPVKK